MELGLSTMYLFDAERRRFAGDRVTFGPPSRHAFDVGADVHLALIGLAVNMCASTKRWTSSVVCSAPTCSTTTRCHRLRKTTRCAARRRSHRAHRDASAVRARRDARRGLAPRTSSFPRDPFGEWSGRPTQRGRREVSEIPADGGAHDAPTARDPQGVRQCSRAASASTSARIGAGVLDALRVARDPQHGIDRDPRFLFVDGLRAMQGREVRQGVVGSAPSNGIAAR